jgi:predicted TIM-barrel fold metal-dependent hydrolase
VEPLSEDLVERTWEEVALFTPARGRKEMGRLGKNQPDLLSFIMEFSVELDQQVKELALYMFVVVYRMFEKGYGKKIKRVTPKEIMACHEANERLMEGMEAAHDRFFERIARVQISSQPFVIKYVVDAIFEAPEDEDPVSLTDEDAGFLFLLLKTVIDALNKKTD